MQIQQALITGATSGIGEALAQLLASKGISLILTGRNRDKLEELKKRLGAQIIQADLGKERAEVIALIREQAPDLVINNAGFGFYGHALTLSVEEQLDMVEVNDKAPLELTLEVGNTQKKKGKKGIILNVSSVASLLSTPGMSVYGASKAFLTSLSKGLDFEFKSLGIRVLVSLPGMVETNFKHRSAKQEVSGKESFSMKAEDVALSIWKQIEREKGQTIIDWRYKMISLLLPFIPKKILNNTLWKRLQARL